MKEHKHHSELKQLITTIIMVVKNDQNYGKEVRDLS